MTSKVTNTKNGTEVTHGTIGAYTNHDCRCEECIVAHREYQTDYRNRTPHQRELSTLNSRVRYWAGQVELRELRRDADPDGYLKTSGSVREAQQKLRRWREAHEALRLTSDTARDRTRTSE